MIKKILLLLLFMLIVLSSFTYSDSCDSTYLDTHTISYFKLEENAFNYVDTMGNLDLTIGNAPSRTTGIIDYGQDFIFANSDYVSTIATGIYENVPFTWMLWVKPDSIGIKMYMMENRLIATNRQGCIFDVESTGKIRLLCYENAGTNQGYMDTNELIKAGQWTHLVGMYDSGYKIYINGTQATQAAGDAGVPGYDTDQPLNIGTLDAAGSYFNGLIDEVAVFDIGLNQTCITYLYNSHAPTSSQQPPYTGGAPPINTTNLTTTLIYPTNNTHYNIINPFNISKKFNGTISLTTNINANCSINDTDFTLETTGNITHIFQNNTGLVEKNYSIIVTCNNVVNTTITNFWFIVDNTDVLASVNFLNNSIQANQFNLRVSYFDLYLYRTNTTIIRESDNFVIYNNYSGDLGYETEVYNVTYPINILNPSYIIGDRVKIIVNGVDTHTSKKFNETPKTTKVTIGNKNIKNYNLKYGDFKLEYSKDMEIEEDYTYDRVHFKLKSEKLKGKDTYQYVEADKIVYYENSDYPCHMIINDKYWYDCDGMKEPKVSKERNNRYKINFFMDSEEVITKSLGGLNEIYTEYFFTINKNYTGNINTSNFFNPPNALFNYTSLYDFSVSSLLMDEECITITGANVSSYDGKYCYNFNLIELEDVVLFPTATNTECYINISNSTGDIINTNFNWFDKDSIILKSGSNNCDSNAYCTLDDLSGALVTDNNSITCRAILNQSWFNFSQDSNTLDTATIGLCDGATLIYPIANFTYFSEITGTSLNVSASYDLTFFEGVSTFTIISNNSGSYTEFCTDINPTISIFNLKLYNTIILSAPTYISRVFNIPFSQGLDVSNNPYYNYSYYLIEIGNSTTLTYTWKSTDYAFLDGIMLINRCEDDGTKTLIESTVVAGGTATANLQLYTTPYSYSIIVDDVLYEESQYNDCHIESINTQTYFVDISQIDIKPVVGLYLLDCNIYNISATAVKMEWDANSEDASELTACIVGWRDDIYGRTKVYESCINATSGSFIRNIGLTGFNYYVTGEITQNGIKGYCQDEVSFNQRSNTSTTFGITGLFLVGIIIVCMILIFAGEGEMQIGGAIIGLVAAWFIGLISFGWLIISSIIFFGVAIAVIGRYTKRT